jgi:hypothetical protein
MARGSPSPAVFTTAETIIKACRRKGENTRFAPTPHAVSAPSTARRPRLTAGRCGHRRGVMSSGHRAEGSRAASSQWMTRREYNSLICASL